MIPEKYLFMAARHFPKIAFFSTLGLSVYYRKRLFYILFILFNIAEVTNRILKYFAEKFMGNKSFGIIGKGTRPKKRKPNFSATHYGMPSGHSQGAASLATYLGLYVYNDKTMDRKPLLLTALLFATIFIMYSRVVEKWHTIQQVIIGALIGVVLGNAAYMIMN